MASSTPRISGLNILEKSANMNTTKSNSISQQSIISKIADKYGYITQYLPSLNISNEGSRIFIAILIPILIFLLILLYNNLYSTVNKSVLDTINYEKQLSEQIKLPSCYEIPENKKYRLADYYISASYMTPCIRNLHYDYVSIDMIKRVLQSGARYIQIPICQENVSYESEPVIATAEFGSRVITSLNTLSPIETFSNIVQSAFIIKKKHVNYPLIIELILHTDNKYTLDILGDIIIKECGKYLINDPKKYENIPLSLEELCKLNGKILIISTPGYKNTKLENIIIPTTLSSNTTSNLSTFQKMHYSDINKFNLTKEDYYKSKYNKLISEKNALIDNKNSDKKYAEFIANELQKIDNINNSTSTNSTSTNSTNLSNIGNTIKNDENIADKLSNFNKVGITVLEPNYTTDTTPTNYDFTYALSSGCQILLMNFQVNDNYISEYLKIFNEGGFKLKPDGIRIPHIDNTIDYSMPVGITDEKRIPVLNNFYSKYKNTVFTLETNVKPGLYLSYDKNLQLLKYTTSTGTAGTKQNGLNQCYTLRNSTLQGEDTSIIISPIIDDTRAITYDRNNGFNLANISDTVKGIKQQAFYPVNPKSVGDPNNISLLLVDQGTPVYIGYKEGGGIVALDNNFDANKNDAMTLKINPVKYDIYLQIVSLFDGGYGIKSYDNSVVGLVKNGLTDATKYLISFVNNNGNNSLYDNEIYLINTTKKSGLKTYLQSTENNIQDKVSKPDKTCKFKFVKNKGFVSIIDYKDRYLVANKGNLLQFQDEENIINSGNENRYLFKIAKNYVII